MNTIYGIKYLAMLRNREDWPFGDEHRTRSYWFAEGHSAQVTLDCQRKKAKIRNTGEFDGLYNVISAVEKFDNILNDGNLSRVVAITAEQKNIPFEIVCTHEISGKNETDFTETINPDMLRRIL